MFTCIGSQRPLTDPTSSDTRYSTAIHPARIALTAGTRPDDAERKGAAGMRRRICLLMMGSQDGQACDHAYRRSICAGHALRFRRPLQACLTAVCHSREGGNPLRRILRRPWFLDSCFRRNDSVYLGILPSCGDRRMSALPFPENLLPPSGRDTGFRRANEPSHHNPFDPGGAGLYNPGQDGRVVRSESNNAG